MKNWLTLVVLTGQVIFWGCAVSHTQVVREASLDLPVSPQIDKALIYIVRPAILGIGIPFYISVQKPNAIEYLVGQTMGKQYVCFYLIPGEYVLTSKAENTSCLSIEVEPGKVYYFKQVPKMGVIKARNKLIRIDEGEGRSSLRTTSRGKIAIPDFSKLVE